MVDGRLKPGISGGASDLTRAKLSPLKKGWVLTSAAPRLDPNRVLGSLFNNPEMRSRAWCSRREAGEWVGKVSGLFTMLCSVTSFDGAAKGVPPYIIS